MDLDVLKSWSVRRLLKELKRRVANWLARWASGLYLAGMAWASSMRSTPRRLWLRRWRCLVSRSTSPLMLQSRRRIDPPESWVMEAAAFSSSCVSIWCTECATASAVAVGL